MQNENEAQRLWARVEVQIARRDFLGKNIPSCPSCFECMQIQLLDMGSGELSALDVKPARWRCRRCKHCWSYEPAVSMVGAGEIQGLSLRARLKAFMGAVLFDLGMLLSLLVVITALSLWVM